MQTRMKFVKCFDLWRLNKNSCKSSTVSNQDNRHWPTWVSRSFPARMLIVFAVSGVETFPSNQRVLSTKALHIAVLSSITVCKKNSQFVNLSIFEISFSIKSICTLLCLSAGANAFLSSRTNCFRLSFKKSNNMFVERVYLSPRSSLSILFDIDGFFLVLKK